MGSKFTCSVYQPLTWPKKCVGCGKATESTYPLYSTSLEGFSFRIIYSTISYSRKNILSFPICQRHKYTIFLLRLVMFISSVAVVGFGINLLIFFLVEREGSLIFSVILFLLSIGILIASIKFQPVRFKLIEPNNMTITINNSQYAREFSYVNKLRDDG